LVKGKIFMGFFYECFDIKGHSDGLWFETQKDRTSESMIIAKYIQ
jgi:hypothetical protein